MNDTTGDTGLHTTAIDWVSDDPHLSSNFAPVGPEIEAADLPVAGRIPEAERGISAQRLQPAVQASRLRLSVLRRRNDPLRLAVHFTAVQDACHDRPPMGP